jgi:ketopantoate reductase
MARDFERGRQTELEAITGALVRLASEHGVDVPVTRTAYALLKLRQSTSPASASAAASEKSLGTAAAGR